MLFYSIYRFIRFVLCPVNAITQAIRIENQSLPSTDTWNPGASVSYTIGISRKTISVMSENDITSWEGGTDSETVNGTEEKQITN